MLKFSFKKENEFESPVMFIFSLVQVFLSSMILGVIFFDELKIGSTPFLSLKEAMPNLPVWTIQPNFVPKDGLGLNPLLQNYWMVIHPPTLFLGFATTLIPFAYAMAGLWKRQYTAWVRPALPWALLSALILGTGIMMGAIWAYETLNFGGYWNWDPVENAVYVPWLIMVAGIHTMLINKKNASALKTSFILIIAQFILILYSTFLTRSGILGNASVHSFTDLGLSGQLLIYLLVFLLGSITLCIWRWKELPSDEKELSAYSPDFWVFLGVTILCLAGFQVIVTTSIPVYNKIAELFGQKLNMAMPADQIAHFTKFQMWFFVVITILTGIGQYFWWRGVKASNFLQKFTNPLILTLFIAALIITFFKVNNWQYILVLTASLFSLAANGSILIDILKRKTALSGGAITHIGVAFMLLGILFSAGYSKVISLNYTGMEISKNTKENNENIILWLNKPYMMSDFSLTYQGQFVDIRGVGYIEKEKIKPIAGDFRAIAKTDFPEKNIKKGDTLEYEAENTYYKVSYDADGKTFALYPRYQINQRMGNVASPDIKKLWNKDIYTHVNGGLLEEDDRQWSPAEEHRVAIGDTIFLNDYVAILDNVARITEVEDTKLGPNDAAVEAQIRVLDSKDTVMMKPKFVIKDQMLGRITETNDQLGLKIQLREIDPKAGTFLFSVNRGQKAFIVMKALEKPHINLLWLGTALVLIGMFMAIWRRFQDKTI